MKLIIDIPEEVYKLGALGLYFDCYSMRLHDTILSGTPIPDNATNGEVIQTLFPNEHDFETDFDEEWWNSPYQSEGSRNNGN